MRSFFKFNDNSEFVIDTSLIIAFYGNDCDLELYYTFANEKGTETLCYQNKKKRDLDYDRLVVYLKAEQVKKEKRIRKLSLTQQAMKEVNQFLDKSRKEV